MHGLDKSHTPFTPKPSGRWELRAHQTNRPPSFHHLTKLCVWVRARAWSHHERWTCNRFSEHVTSTAPSAWGHWLNMCSHLFEQCGQLSKVTSMKLHTRRLCCTFGLAWNKTWRCLADHLHGCVAGTRQKNKLQRCSTGGIGKVALLKVFTLSVFCCDFTLVG